MFEGPQEPSGLYKKFIKVLQTPLPLASALPHLRAFRRQDADADQGARQAQALLGGLFDDDDDEGSEAPRYPNAVRCSFRRAAASYPGLLDVSGGVFPMSRRIKSFVLAICVTQTYPPAGSLSSSCTLFQLVSIAAQVAAASSTLNNNGHLRAP